MNIGDKEYREKLKQYFEEVGPNTGTNMAGKWAWSITQEKEFQKKLREAGELTEIKREKLPS
jgi:hypothetical protein